MATEAPERIDDETVGKASERLAAMGITSSSSAPPAPAPAQRVRKPRSDAGTRRATPAPGMVTLELEIPVSEAHELLGYMLRTGKSGVAHQLVDAIAKASATAD